MILKESVVEAAAAELLRKASTELPADVREALRSAYEAESGRIARMNLEAILRNTEAAGQESLPLCQDTGLPVFFVSGNIGGIKDISAFEEAIRSAVRAATQEIPLRPNAVHPLTRKNSGDNTGSGIPHIRYRPTDEEWLEITVFPKGAGSENMSFLSMLPPAKGVKGVMNFVLDAVVRAGGKSCPPGVIGVGIGGTADLAMELAKKALLRPLGSEHPEPEISSLEKELLGAINETGIGPMGLGGKITALAVHVEYAYCHTASLPVAVNTQCWAGRRATARIHPDGKVEYM